MGQREHRVVLIRAGAAAVRARLLGNPVADLVWSRLPIYARAEVARGLVHFRVGARSSAPSPLPVLDVGVLAYLAELNWMGIGLEPAVSDAPIPSRRWSPWATLLDDPARLRDVGTADPIALLLAES
jgi:hypothetical protein